MYCMNCGEQNDDGARFCKKCGHPLYHEASDAAEGQQNPESQLNQQGQQPSEGQQNQRTATGAADQNTQKPIQIFAVVMCVILAWSFLQNGVPAFYNIITSFFYSVFDGFYFAGFAGTLGANLFRLLQAASFALMAAIMFTVFRRWKDKKASEYILSAITAGAVMAAVGLIRLLLFELPLFRYSSYHRLSWFIWIIFLAGASIGGLIAFTESMGIPIKLMKDGNTFSTAVKSALQYVLSEFLDELRIIQEKNAASKEAADGAKAEGGQSMNSKRFLKTSYSFLSYLFIGWITCGIYDLYLIHCISRDINISGQGDENTPGLLTLILLSLVTCGIYYYIYFYKLANKIQRVGNRYGLQIQENGTTILLWIIFGALICGIGPYIAMYQIFKNMNKVNDAYNKTISSI